MAKAEVWLCASAVLLTTVCWGFTDHIASPVAGVLFIHMLKRMDFQNGLISFQSNIISDTNDCLSFATNLKGHPDRPEWLRYTQRTVHHDGILYGTPTLNDIGRTVIEVTAYNRDTFETMRQMLIFNVKPPMELQLLYEAEFFVKNRNVEEVLPLQEQEYIRSSMGKIWETDRLVIINITSALDVGGRVPLPIKGRKEGVYIKVGSAVPFPDCLKEETDPDKLCDENLDPTSCEDYFSPHFILDWCKIVLFDKSKPEQPDTDVIPGDGVLEGGEYEPPSSSLEGRDLYSDYAVTIAVPLAIAVLLFLLLAYIMYCRREGLERRDTKTSDIQLVHHHSIQGNTNELRQMAKARDVPQPLSTLPMFNVRTGQRVPPLSSCDFDSSRVPLIQTQQ
ncbi:epsilon-sarcoglycan [Callorhinchus milii]|uniref:epsilon-sarcoglycan n=1 Tax=Callorhinchus milii TaxID=7868 RepID=UPI0004572D8A|nr:epsilon-sarcoglycan [Callorhinchus milii]|eukprot:gi/632983957/ref/XP_007908903.1/ PREDICTED: epsilon-sarcoglycan-like [Callorhinchus milii]